jgi:cobyrinic acid a,c-diamide synthase
MSPGARGNGHGPPRGLIVSALRSGAGKTTVALGLMRALSRAGRAVQPFKNGPDYIDPAFHAAAAARPSFNLDSWAMPKAMVRNLVARSREADITICEGSMGLFDGGARSGAWGNGATADIARLTGWPVLLVLDVTGQAQSVAAEAVGARRLDPAVHIAAVVLNRVASHRHEALARDAVEAVGVPVVGAVGRDEALKWPERHLGLIQAGELPWLDAHLDRLADAIAHACDLDRIVALAGQGDLPDGGWRALAPPAQRIAIARDEAFSFVYPHLIEAWRQAGAELTWFSPLADQAPNADADLVWLPGGYPELHAGRLASNESFLAGLRRMSLRVPVHGECGGYMVLGEMLEDAAGDCHRMAGLLGHWTSFARRKLSLGYREVVLKDAMPLAAKGARLRGHEFHYATIAESGTDRPLADVYDAHGAALGSAGGCRERVTGSFFHLIAAAA